MQASINGTQYSSSLLAPWTTSTRIVAIATNNNINFIIVFNVFSIVAWQRYFFVCKENKFLWYWLRHVCTYLYRGWKPNIVKIELTNCVQIFGVIRFVTLSKILRILILFNWLVIKRKTYESNQCTYILEKLRKCISKVNFHFTKSSI